MTTYDDIGTKLQRTPSGNNVSCMGLKVPKTDKGTLAVNFHKVTPYYVNARPTGVYAWLDAYEKTDLMSDSSRSSIRTK